MTVSVFKQNELIMPYNPEIKSLRTQGRFEEALSTALQGYNQDPSDIWSLRDLAWVYYDILKSAVGRKDTQSIINTNNLIVQLNIPNDETMFYENYNKLKKYTNPQYFDLIDAKEYSKSGQRQQAINLYRKLIELFPFDNEIIEGFAWEIEKELKDLVDGIEKSNKSDIIKSKLHSLRKYLAEVLNLNIAKPSDLYSFALIYTFQIATYYDKFPYFVKKWGLENFRFKDFERYQKDGKSFPSLVEKVIISCSKSIEKHSYLDLVDYFLDHFPTIVTKYPDNIWLKYHNGKLLILGGKIEEAKQFILPVVREKQSESWAWGLLGNTFAVEDIEKSIACFCKGISVCNQENFITNIRLELAKALIEKELYAEARCEIELVYNYKINESQKLNNDINNYFNEEWFKNAHGLKNNNELYEKYSNLADSILLDALPWVNAIIKSVDINSERVFLFLQNNLDATVKFKLNNNIRNMKEGAPVRVKIGNEIGKITTYAIEKREGENWDLIPFELGVIDHVNLEKKVSHIILNSKHSCLMHFDQFQELSKCLPGTFVKCKVLAPKKPDELFHLKHCVKTDEMPSEKIFRMIRGTFKDPKSSRSEYDHYSINSDEEENEESNEFCQTFGFIKTSSMYDDVYVSKSLVIQSLLKHQDNVISGAVISKNKKGHDSWKAVWIKKSES